MSEDTTTIREQLKKIAALAERGATEDERDTATRLLNRLLAKHNLTIEQVLGSQEQRKERHFTYQHGWERKLLIQVAARVCGHGDFTVSHIPKQKRNKTKDIWLELTEAEYLEIANLYPQYRDAFEKEIPVFLRAFIQANKLGMPRREDDDAEEPELTPEQRAELLRMLQMAQGITPTGVTSIRSQLAG